MTTHINCVQYGYAQTDQPKLFQVTPKTAVILRKKQHYKKV